MGGRTLASRLERSTRGLVIAALLCGAVLPVIVSAQPASAAEQTYVSEVYGYSIAWDDTDWLFFSVGTGEEDAIMLTHTSFGGVLLAGMPSEFYDEAECLQAFVSDIQTRPKLTDFSLIRRGYSKPDLPDAGEAEMYSYLSGDDQLETVGYFECRSLGDEAGFVTILAATTEPLWEDFVPALEDLMAEFDSGGGSGESDDDTGSTQEDDSGPRLGKKTPTPSGGEEDEEDTTDREGSGGLEGNTYTGLVVDFSVTWDEGVWGDPETDIDPEGAWESVGIYSDLAYAYFEGVFPEKVGLELTDAESCLEDYAGFMETGDGVEEFKRMRRAELPTTDPDAVGGVFTYVYTDSEGSAFEMQSYAECRKVSADSFLFIRMNAEVDLWDDAVADLEELLASVETGTGERASGGEEQAGGLVGNTYTGQVVDFSFSWDEAVWPSVTAETYPDDGYEFVELNSALTYVFIGGATSAALSEDTTDGETCLAELVENTRSKTEAISDFKKLRRVTMPESAVNVFAEAYTYIYTDTEGNESLIQSYFECRQVTTDSFLLVRMNTEPEDWEDSVAELEDVLATVKTGPAVAEPGGEEKTGGLDGNTYTGVNFDFSLTWDEAFWGTPNTFLPEEGQAWETLEFNGDTVFLFVEATRPAELEDQETWGFTDAEGCLESYLNGNIYIPEVTDLEEDSRRSLPETDPEAVNAAFTYTHTPDGGQPSELHSYFECRPIGDGTFLYLRMNVFPADWETAVPELEQFLADIRVGGGSGDVNTSNQVAGTNPAAPSSPLAEPVGVIDWSASGTARMRRFDEATFPARARSLPTLLHRQRSVAA